MLNFIPVLLEKTEHLFGRNALFVFWGGRNIYYATIELISQIYYLNNQHL